MIRVLPLAFGLVFSCVLFLPQERVAAQEMTYEGMRAEMGRLFQEERFSEAAALLADGLERYPDHVMANSFNLAFMYVRMEEPEKSLEALRYGLDRGVWYGKYVFMAPAWEPVRALPGWEGVAARNQEAMERAWLESEPEVEVVLPEDFDPEKQYPLFIALHGGGENLQGFMPMWTSDALRRDFIVLYPQSSLLIAQNGYNWMEDMEVSRKEILAAYQEVMARYPIDPERVIVGGFSAGGVTALDLVLQDVFPIKGFVTLCPPMPEGFSAEAVAAARDRGVRGTVLTTEMDPRVEEQREMVTVMEREGLPHEFIVAPNTGHWYPADLSVRIDQALRHITGNPFIKHEIAGGFTRVNNVHAADVDGDGDLDVLATAFTDDGIRLWYNLGGSPLAWSAQNIDLGLDGAHFIQSADMDGDGDLDLLSAAQLAGQLAWFRNDGGQPVSWTKSVVDDAYPGAQQVFSKDMDADGDLDLVATAYNAGDASWYRNEGGDPTAWTKMTISASIGGPVSCWPVDLDQDDDFDVLTAGYNDGVLSWWRNDGGEPITWSQSFLGSTFQGAHEVRAADIDGDGDPDVFAGAYALSDVRWWRNDGGNPIQWHEEVIDPQLGGAASVSSADMDGDGDLDILGTGQDAGELAWYINDGKDPITWSKIIIDNDLAGAWAHLPYDLDGDGDMDVLAGGTYSHQVVWYENRSVRADRKPHDGGMP